MPSTLLHVAVGGLVGSALLADEFDARAVAVVLVAAALPDLDSFTALVLPGTHRALLHNLLIPAIVAGVLAYDTRRNVIRSRLARSVPDRLSEPFPTRLNTRAPTRLDTRLSARLGTPFGALRLDRLRVRWGDRGVRLAWVALAAFVCGGILPDLFTNGVNAFYPLHDAFYTVDGKLLLSNQRGLVQTFVDLAPEEPAPSTDTMYYVTGVDPSPGEEPKRVERIFPVARGGWQLMLILVSAGVLAARLWTERDR